MTTKTPVGRRAAAWLVDYAVIWSILTVAWLYQPFAKPDETGNYGFAGCALFLISAALYLAYFAVPEALWGQTAGKALLSIEVRTIEGRRATLVACLKRHILDLVDFQFFALPAFITVKVTPLGQRVGDLFAHTVVVEEIAGEQPPSNSG